MKTAEQQDLQDLAKVFKALSHPIRLKITCGLVKKETCNVNTMAERLGLPQPSVSQHLNVLKAAGIIEGCRKANQICYKVHSDAVKKFIKNLSVDFCLKGDEK